MIGKVSVAAVVVAAAVTTTEATYSCDGLVGNKLARCEVVKPLFDFFGYDSTTFTPDCNLAGDPCLLNQPCVQFTCEDNVVNGVNNKIVTGVDLEKFFADFNTKISFKGSFSPKAEQLPAVIAALSTDFKSPIVFSNLTDNLYQQLFKDICGTDAGTDPVSVAEGVIAVDPKIFKHIQCAVNDDENCFDSQLQATKDQFLDADGNWGKQVNKSGCDTLNALTVVAPTGSPTLNPVEAPGTPTKSPTEGVAPGTPTTSPTEGVAPGTPTTSPTNSAAGVATGIVLSVMGLFLQF